MKNLDMEQANTSEHPVQDHEELRDTEFLSEVTGGELSRQWTTIGTGAIGGLFGSVGGGATGALLNRDDSSKGAKTGMGVGAGIGAAAFAATGYKMSAPVRAVVS